MKRTIEKRKRSRQGLRGSLGLETGARSSVKGWPASDKLATARMGCVEGSGRSMCGRVGSERWGRGCGMIVGTANVGSLNGREGEVSDMLQRRKVDICCLQEIGWKGSGCVWVGDYKFMWIGDRKGKGGVGVAVAKKWEEKVVEVKRVNDRIMVVKANVDGEVLNVVCVYAPQSGRTEIEKERFYDELDDVVSGVRKGERLMVAGDFNGHVGERIEGYEGVHGGHGYGVRNKEGERLLEFVDSREMIVANTWFKKEDSKKISYESGGCRTVIDYFLVRKEDRRCVIDVKAIPGEPCLLQHKLMVCRLFVRKQTMKGRVPFVSKCKVWKLREPKLRAQFGEMVQERKETRDKAEEESAEGIWQDLKQCLLEGTEEVCGRTKGPRVHRETWWWNKETDRVVEEKRTKFRELKKAEELKKTNDLNEGKSVEEAAEAYKQAKRNSKRVIWRVKEAERKKMREALDKKESEGKLFRAVKQMERKNRDVVGGGCLKDGTGRTVTDVETIKEMWRSHFERISNEEFDWDRDSLSQDCVSGPIAHITDMEVREAMKKMKNGKASGPSGVVSEMLSAAGEVELCG